MKGPLALRIAAGLFSVLLALSLDLDAAEAHTLTAGRATQAAKARADQIAGQSTRVSTIFRTDHRPGHGHAFYAQASWTRPLPELPSVRTLCFVELRVRYASPRSRKVVVSMQGKVC